MFDRKGRLVVDVGPAFSITVTPAMFDTNNIVFFSSLLQMDPVFVQGRINRGRAYSQFSSVRIKRDVDFKTLTSIEENVYLLPGVNYDIESKRLYPPVYAPRIFLDTVKKFLMPYW